MQLSLIGQNGVQLTQHITMTSNPFRDQCNTDFAGCTVRCLVGITIFTSLKDIVTYALVCFILHKTCGSLSGGMSNSAN